MSVQVLIDDASVIRLFASYPEAATRRLRGLIEASAVDVQRMMRIAANVGATGDLRRSIKYTTSSMPLSARIYPDVPYAEDVEKGTPPHWTSARPGSSLAKWANIKGLNPYAVQKSIAKKGTQAHPYVAPTARKMRPIVQRDVIAGMSRFVSEVNRGLI